MKKIFITISFIIFIAFIISIIKHQTNPIYISDDEIIGKWKVVADDISGGNGNYSLLINKDKSIYKITSSPDKKLDTLKGTWEHITYSRGQLKIKWENEIFEDLFIESKTILKSSIDQNQIIKQNR